MLKNLPNFPKKFKKVSFIKKFRTTHPVLCRNLWQFLKFGLIGWALTIIQFLGYTYLPYLFGEELAAVDWFWPKLKLPYGGGKYYWSLIGFDVLYNADGSVKIGGGLGYTLSWVITFFSTQFINFPLQRRITYKSHGNIGYQFLLYFLSLIGVTLASNALNSLWIGPASEVLPTALYQVFQTLATSGLTTFAFFFVFKLIFPEGKPGDNFEEEYEAKKKYATLVKGIYLG